MAKMNLPLVSQGLSNRSPLPPMSPLSDYVQQSLAVLLGYTYGETVPLRSSPSGVLYVAEPRITDIFTWKAAAIDEYHQGSNLPCTQVMCLAHPDNTGRIWLAARRLPTVTDSIPLDKTQSWTFSVENLNELQALIKVANDQLVVAYSL